MSDNHRRRNQMASAATAGGGAASSRVDQAIRVLCRLDDHQLATVVWDRARGRTDHGGLPTVARDEDPGDIFLSVVYYGNNHQLAEKLRTVCGRLLERAVSNSRLRDPTALGELCYVSARIGAAEAIAPITTFAEREDVIGAKLPSGESLRLRALRCLSGLLAKHRDHVQEQRHRVLFERHLTKPGCESVALTTLIGLWPKCRREFIGKLPKNHVVDQKALKASLAVAGFGAASRRASAAAGF